MRTLKELAKRQCSKNLTINESVYLLILFPEKPPDSPKTMFISQDQWVEEGGMARLYCEALVGKDSI